MRAPPPVSAECVAGAGWCAAQACLHAAAAVALSVWVGERLGLGAMAWVPAWAAGGLAFAVGWAMAKAPSTRLRWTGEQWRLCPEGQAEMAALPPTVAVDLGRWMLLQATTASAPHVAWLAVSRRCAGTEWLPLRAAVYSAAPEHTLPSLPERAPF